MERLAFFDPTVCCNGSRMLLATDITVQRVAKNKERLMEVLWSVWQREEEAKPREDPEAEVVPSPNLVLPPAAGEPEGPSGGDVDMEDVAA